MIYYTADLHFGHRNVISMDGRPFNTVEEMNKTLIDNWNSRVTNKDDVYIIGDIAFRSETDVMDILKGLKGRKHLILGNHDKPIEKVWKNNRDKVLQLEDVYDIRTVTDTVEGRNVQVVMCHYPIVEWPYYFRDSYHVYGHIHNNKNRAYEVMKGEPRALNAGCMINNYMPVTLGELIMNNNIYFGRT